MPVSMCVVTGKRSPCRFAVAIMQARLCVCALEVCSLTFIPEPKEEDIGREQESPMLPPPVKKIAAGSSGKLSQEDSREMGLQCVCV